MIDNNEMNEIKRRLNRGTSAIFVIGQAIDKRDGVSNSPEIHRLYSSDMSVVGEAWANLLSENPVAQELPFLSGFSNWVDKTAPVKMAKFSVLNTSISTNIGEVASNMKTIDLNGRLHRGICKQTGVTKLVNTAEDATNLAPTFISKDKNYSDLYDAICELEEFVSEHNVRSIFFIEASDTCPITESIFNRSLVRTLHSDPIFKVVVNKNASYMDDEADLVVRMDGHEFLSAMEAAYSVEGFDKR